MSTLEKVALAIVGVAALYTAVAPDHHTAQVATAFGGVFTNALKVATGR